MTKQSSMLQKKVQELEHELIHEVFSLPAETRLFFFLRKLLSAETTSSSKRPQHRLQQIEKRLSDLETAFNDRNKNNKTETTQGQIENVSCSGSCLDDGGDLTFNETVLSEFEESGNVFQSLMAEATPLAVTTQDQLQNVPSTEGSWEFEEAENAFQSVIKEKTPSMETEMIRVPVKKRSGRVFWGLASGVVIGTALMGFLTEILSGSFPHLKQSVCLPPT
ncbi:transmembrane protein [Salix suchowensis]|nr:transmembrane protein [Salix suchowensis]